MQRLFKQLLSSLDAIFKFQAINQHIPKSDKKANSFTADNFLFDREIIMKEILSESGK